MKCFTLHVMNLKYMKVSLFETSYKKKVRTFSRHSIFLRCTCTFSCKHEVRAVTDPGMERQFFLFLFLTGIEHPPPPPPKQSAYSAYRERRYWFFSSTISFISHKPDRKETLASDRKAPPPPPLHVNATSIMQQITRNIQNSFILLLLSILKASTSTEHRCSSLSKSTCTLQTYNKHLTSFALSQYWSVLFSKWC